MHDPLCKIGATSSDEPLSLHLKDELLAGQAQRGVACALVRVSRLPIADGVHECHNSSVRTLRTLVAVATLLVG
jgi:hypothetical protein